MVFLGIILTPSSLRPFDEILAETRIGNRKNGIGESWLENKQRASYSYVQPIPFWFARAPNPTVLLAPWWSWYRIQKSFTTFWSRRTQMEVFNSRIEESQHRIFRLCFGTRRLCITTSSRWTAEKQRNKGVPPTMKPFLDHFLVVSPLPPANHTGESPLPIHAVGLITSRYGAELFRSGKSVTDIPLQSSIVVGFNAFPSWKN